ncbi:MAG: type I polyketide synthase, partial [Rhodocyclaceae bacterium]
MTVTDLQSDAHAVAIVGIGCRFPGGVTDPASFWRFLVEGRDAIAEIPSDRIDLAHFYDERPATPGRIMTRWGGFLSRLDEFDAGFFGISPREAERLDPAQRLVLETAWEGLEDAGIAPTHLDGTATGVFVGQWLSDFEGRLFADPEVVDFYMTTGSGRYATSGRLSYLLGLRGPSLTLDTACSSSLVAVHLAARSLRAGECTLALAGGVNVILQPHISVAYSQSRMMAPDGRCKFGDARGDGYVRSEGAGIVVLKPLAAALADGDRIYAVIRGSAVNNDGHSSGSMGTPSRSGQEALLRSAYADAGVAPGRVGYVEAHGTGTRAGDPVELGALGAVLGEGRPGGERARVGSVKTNFGHTEGAAGVAGLIKVTLAVHHARIPASLHCHELNPVVDWANAPYELARSAVAWDAPSRVGGVSAFGIAGTNAHVVLENAPPPFLPADANVLPSRPALLVLSARSPEALRALAAAYAVRLDGADRAMLDAVCWSAATRRGALEHRAAFVADDAGDLVTQLNAFAAGEAAAAEGTVHAAPALGPVFVAPGQGGQWLGMARALLVSEPAFRDALQACDEAARPWLANSIVEQLRLAADHPDYRLDRIELIQPALVAVAIACGRWLQSLGIVPAAVVGHSMGEVAAAQLAGVLDLGQAMRIICRRSALMGRTSGRGAMAMIDLPMAEAEQRLAGREALLSVAVSNSPRSCVVSGDPAALQALMTELEAAGVFCRLVKVDVASHSPQMETPAAELTLDLADLVPGEATVPLHSTVLACAATGREFGAGYWGRNMRQPVRFTDTIDGLLAAGARCFVELGLHPVLTVAVQQTAQARGQAVATLVAGRRDEPEQRNALALVAGLWA